MCIATSAYIHFLQISSNLYHNHSQILKGCWNHHIFLYIILETIQDVDVVSPTDTTIVQKIHSFELH
jgi:hypothetical protein